MNPAHLQKTLVSALEHHNAGRLDAAEKLYRQALAMAPRLFDALHLLGTLHFQKARYNEALALLQKAHQISPTHGICEMRLGLTLAALGRHPEAEPRLRAAALKEPRSVDAWLNLAVTLRVLGKFPETRDALFKALALKPDSADLHDRLGALVADTEGLPAGIPHFQRAVQLNPQFAQGWCNLGLSLSGTRQYGRALEALERARALDPSLLQAEVGRAFVLLESYRTEEAVDAYHAVLKKQPTHLEAGSGRLLALNYLGGVDRQTVFEEHRAFGDALIRERGSVAFGDRDLSKEKLRLAFLSSDLRSHSVAYFLEPLLQNLSRDRFDIVLYHDHTLVDAMSQRLRAHGTLWRNFAGQLNQVVESTIRADAPDILVDLAGHTGLNRMAVLARRVAPVQVSYLGYPNTTGLRTMDYRLVDTLTDPDDQDSAYHTERLVRFSTCAWCYAPPANAPETGRAVSAAPAPTFGSFNNPSKLSPTTFALWARILAEVPEAQLLLKGHGLDDPEVRAVIQQRMKLAGIPLERVALLARTPSLSSHLEIYQRVDVALDAYPYHGTTTTCEALWMGVPVVSLRGDRHASRVGTSLLTAVGRGEWSTGSPDAYVAKAVELIRNPDRLALERRTLRQSMRESVLLDPVGQAQRFAAALERCWRGDV